MGPWTRIVSYGDVTTPDNLSKRYPIILVSDKVDMHKSRRPAVILLLCIVLLLAICIASLHLGARASHPTTVWQALTGASGSEAIIIRDVRLPRTLTALFCGAVLALSGFFMQASTRNPLAEPGVLGVNTGAAFAAVLTFTVLGLYSLWAISIAAFVGALCTVAAVFALAALSDRRFDPATTLLAGVTLAALLGSLTTVVLISNQSALEILLFWLSGSFADRDLALVVYFGPTCALCLWVAVQYSSAFDALRADDETASALGVPVRRIRLISLVCAALCAGVAVSVAGPVAFIGLVAPHLARRLLPGKAQVWHVLTAVLTGALVAVSADILARVIAAPRELPISAVLALVGVPALIGLLRQRRSETVL